jgi:hypothetical protein
MSFKSFNFKYTPPPTVTSTTTGSIPTAASISNTNTKVIIAPLATAASQALLDLVATSQYLQSLILAQFNNNGITIDPASDPTTAAALAAVYGKTAPPIVTTAMYSNLLDCQLALQSINSALGKDSIAQADPYMLSNVTQINNAVAAALLSSGGSDQVLTQTLSTLKNNAVLFSNLSANLSVYQGSTDLSTSVNANISALTNNTSSLYASLNSLLTTANVINADINNVMVSYVDQPLSDVVAITSAISMLYNTEHKQTATSIFGGLTSLVDTRLLSEVSISYFAADQIVQRMLAPLKAMAGSIGALVNSTNSSIKAIQTPANLAKTTVANTTSPGLSGMPNSNPCSSTILKGLAGSNVPALPSGLAGISSGNQFLGQFISAAMAKVTSEFNQMESSFIALQKRSSAGLASILQVACAMSAAESLITIGNTIISKSGSPTSSTPIAVVSTAAASTTNAALSQTTAVPATSSSTSSSIPIPANVQAVLNKGAQNNVSGVLNA